MNKTIPDSMPANSFKLKRKARRVENRTRKCEELLKYDYRKTLRC